MRNSVYCMLLCAAGLSACAVTPTPIVRQPMSLPAQSAKPLREVNGAIFQTASYRPLYEDAKARMVGDVLTINLSEKTTAGKTSATSGSKSGSVSFATPQIFGMPATTAAQGGLKVTSANKFGEAGAENASNNFSGTITVTVIDVMPNGNLIVSGEKQLGFDKGGEFVRFSGVVNPQTIAAGNALSSTQVADAKFEYRSTSHLDQAEMTSMLTRFFLSFLPL
ncbi:MULTISPECIES: flagellar basal body L-ring protein FlgH [unclassified Undibacterium]|uniref:flagellar basal body L-ring protein FlgH n=1 Tax=unclassified Undibacterium TaxID=2630295 RepID=UPI002AC9DAC2|nr:MULTISPECIES: flagellar basal body L-ring protein FlgH [unclassified Undibacterium]MEB0138782.1 flagellar basal body L-ring protein FlgH [Undibacterium sp. CCC2.1]MEB0170742.1 flagellar basal body L-ring protein FlgH [Undibacterium sp. CCC1.1]MEB0174631.1 flagellar basal body L-ring protein FlgH [Undibacterium sp. CCC3.4]MEB0213828.1 flagellar basal body L-ring protein FlgH [Undibacterium sp. 5I2]WPX42554.1 flagellar basal body L-ring protein FlgH [Undibacterium sp. CCC3.4]